MVGNRYRLFASIRIDICRPELFIESTKPCRSLNSKRNDNICFPLNADKVLMAVERNNVRSATL